MTKGPLIIVSGPSGSGKSTLIRRVLAETGLPLRLSVSATTRAPRPDEENGREYWFWTRAQFEQAIAAGEFLEWACVHGNYYGTPRREVEPYRDQGLGVLLDIDVQGADQVRPLYPGICSIFIRAPSPEVYRERLTARGTETVESLEQRVKAALAEEARAGEYTFIVVNDDLEAAVIDMAAIILACFQGGSMLDELKEEAIVNKVGGRFKLSTLIQKRMVALNTGARPLVEVKGGDKMAIVIQEILQDKIYLDTSNQVHVRGTTPGDVIRRAMLTDVTETPSSGD